MEKYVKDGVEILILLKQFHRAGRFSILLQENRFPKINTSKMHQLFIAGDFWNIKPRALNEYSYIFQKLKTLNTTKALSLEREAGYKNN